MCLSVPVTHNTRRQCGLHVVSNPHPSSASHHSIHSPPGVKARRQIIPWELCSHIGGDLLPSLKMSLPLTVEATLWVDFSNPSIKPFPCVTQCVCVCWGLSFTTTLDSSQLYARHRYPSPNSSLFTAGGWNYSCAFWEIARATGSLRRIAPSYSWPALQGSAVRQRCFEDSLKNIVGMPAGLWLQGMFACMCVGVCLLVSVC